MPSSSIGSDTCKGAHVPTWNSGHEGSNRDAVGPEQEIQLIQLAMHTQEEEVQVPIPQEGASHQEEAHPVVVQAVAVPNHLHHHLQVQPLRSHQEEQVRLAAIQHLLQHLQHLQGIVLWIHGHSWTGPGNLYQSYRYLRTTRTAAFWTCSRCSKFGMTGPHLLKDIGLLKF